MRWKVEWRYFAGRLAGGKHFHYAEFRKGTDYFRHWSLNGVFYEDDGKMGDTFKIDTPQFRLNLKRGDSPLIEHKIPKIEYFSIPLLTDGHIYVWHDHQYMNEVGTDWDWLGFNLDFGITVVAGWRDKQRYADFTHHNHTTEVIFILDNRHLCLPEIGLNVLADDTQLKPPTTREIIHRPKYGRPYSEWAVNIISNMGIIGHGYREKTYKEM